MLESKHIRKPSFLSQHAYSFFVVGTNALMITGVIETFAVCRWNRFHWPWFSL